MVLSTVTDSIYLEERVNNTFSQRNLQVQVQWRRMEVLKWSENLATPFLLIDDWLRDQLFILVD